MGTPLHVHVRRVRERSLERDEHLLNGLLAVRQMAGGQPMMPHHVAAVQRALTDGSNRQRMISAIIRAGLDLDKLTDPLETENTTGPLFRDESE